MKILDGQKDGQTEGQNETIVGCNKMDLMMATPIFFVLE